MLPALVALVLLVQDSPKPSKPWLADRGEGIHTSLFGTYVREDELLLYGFYEYTRNKDAEYKPEDLGFTGNQDFTARRIDHEVLVFAAYGLTPDWMVEFESALYAKSTQQKASDDPSAMPSSVSEHGLGDTEGQIRWRFAHETESCPEFIASFETVLPLQHDRDLIGTQDWEFSPGLFATKGFSWGTLGAKVSLAYDTGDHQLDFGEYGLEYVKRLSETWRGVLAVEGEQDELQAIVEMQWQITPRITLKLNSGFGLTPKAPEFAPEIGIMVSF